MFRHCLLILLATLCVSTAQGQIAVREDRPDQYIVKRGDTLWDISALFLRDPWLWPDIWEVNPQIDNPHLIYPGDTIYFSYNAEGEPRLGLVRGNGTTRPVVKLTPQVRTTPLNTAIESIPLDAILEFLTDARVVSEEEIEQSPYVLAGEERSLLVGQGDEFYARGTFDPEMRVYSIYRKGEDYIDPDTGENLGIRAQSMGRARMQQISDDVARLSVIESVREIYVGDILMPIQQNVIDPIIFPEVPSTPVNGEIIAVDNGLTHIGQLAVVAINAGSEDGLRVGSLLSVLERGENVRDRIGGGTVKLPDERAGLLMTFKILPKMSFGLILEAEKPLAIGYPVATPE